MVALTQSQGFAPSLTVLAAEPMDADVFAPLAQLLAPGDRWQLASYAAEGRERALQACESAAKTHQPLDAKLLAHLGQQVAAVNAQLLRR